jgi:hypothetical protein
MSTDNKSPSYLTERDDVRRWLFTSQDGRVAVDHLRKWAIKTGHNPANLFDDDKYVQWGDMVRAYKGATVLATNNAAARAAFELASQSTSNMSGPGGKDKWRLFARVPLDYHLRRMTETADPDYWNDRVNLYRELLDNPDWCTVPADVIRGELEEALPKNRSHALVAP